MSTRLFISLGAPCLVLAFCISLRAQNSTLDTPEAPTSNATNPSQPPATYGSGQALAPAYTGFVVPNVGTITGFQQISVGISAESHDYLLPSFDAVTQLDTTPGQYTSSVNYVLGHVDLYHTSNRSILQLDYTGGDTFSFGGGTYNSPIQDLEFSETLEWQRWTLLLADGLTYLSQSPFGFGGVGGLGYFGGASTLGLGYVGGDLPFLGDSVIPNQTIPTGNVNRISNTTASQVVYQLTPRSSWTIGGSYGLLRFFNFDYVNSADTTLQTGYNYQRNPTTTVGGLYRFDDFHFTNLREGIEDHVIQLAFGRRVSDRLSFQATAGPDLVIVKSGPLGSTGGPDQALFWRIDTSLKYQFEKMSVTASYDHMPTSGSGVLVGAYTHDLQASVDRTLSSTWIGSASIGYARNQSLVPEIEGSSEEAFNSWYAAARASHRMASGITLFFVYEATLSGTATAACLTVSCGQTYVSHEFSVGLNWKVRPAVFQ